MSSILTTEAVVLSAINYSDTSKIVTLLTKDAGKLSVIAKGVRKSKSNQSAALNPLNVIQAVIYMKPGREVQLLSNADLLVHHYAIEKDFDAIKYALAVIELVNSVSFYNENEEKIYRAVSRILKRMDTIKELPSDAFTRFFLFFLGEMGFAVSVIECNLCRKKLIAGETVFTATNGVLCSECATSIFERTSLPKELFQRFQCLKNGNDIQIQDERESLQIVKMLERYAAIHISDFRGLNSLRM